MSLPHILSSLSPREAVTDALYRVIDSFDTGDAALFDSALASKDPVIEINANAFTGHDEIHKNLFAFISTLDTTHLVTNVRVDVKGDGADTASLTAHALAYHYRQGQGADPAATKFVTGNMYFADMVKDESDGLWKAKKFVCKSIWVDGDVSVMQR